MELAKRVGLNWTYKDVGEVFTEMASVMPSLANITWERMLAEDCVTYPCDAPDKPGNEIIFSASFPTKSGRAKIVPAELLPPDELPDSDYPMVLTTGRLLEHWHTGSMTRRATNLDALEPEAIAGMNPRDIDRMGLEPGSVITVTTRRGSVSLLVRADRDVAEGMVFIPFASPRRRPTCSPTRSSTRWARSPSSSSAPARWRRRTWRKRRSNVSRYPIKRTRAVLLASASFCQLRVERNNAVP